MARNFFELARGKWAQHKFLCVGLDSDLEKIPEHLRSSGTREGIVAFNRGIVDATKDIVCAYKPNPAFYEAHGDEGWDALRETIQYINDAAPEIPVILDGKRADIGNTNDAYAASAFDHLHADALTTQPYPGYEALSAFFEREDKGIFVWCRSSNGGSGELQDLTVNGEPLYIVVARMLSRKWNGRGNCGCIAGATYPEELARVREAVGDMPILVPGIGAQGGDVEKTARAAADMKGAGMIISSSRAVIFASGGKDFAAAARAKAQELHGAIMKAL
ncbi:MAG: orotidine-5-phosphate decarboxylase [Candidatus Parcubacteria bacterium]|jgi:orotidine-5'-phosphate decarboxylase